MVSDIIKCQNNHDMEAMTLKRLSTTNPAYKRGGWCNVCKSSLDGNILHCDLCHYDICFRCVLNKNFGPPNPYAVDYPTGVLGTDHEQTMRSHNGGESEYHSVAK